MKHYMLFAVAMVFGFTVSAHATLILRGQGTSVHGTYNLIYDTDLDITWYDYTNPGNTWQNQVDWADALTVDFGGTIYDDWRLPSTVNGPYVFGWDGTTTGGYNITTSEMGHLYYTELGNLGKMATDGTAFPPGWGLTNTGDFQNLIATAYWSGTGYYGFPGLAWYFSFGSGGQAYNYKNYFGGAYISALAVRSGDVSAAVPEPGTLLLLGSGLAGLALTRKRFGRRELMGRQQGE